jgi:hypothetical protein
MARVEVLQRGLGDVFPPDPRLLLRLLPPNEKHVLARPLPSFQYAVCLTPFRRFGRFGIVALFLRLRPVGHVYQLVQSTFIMRG